MLKTNVMHVIFALMAIYHSIIPFSQGKFPVLLQVGLSDLLIIAHQRGKAPKGNSIVRNEMKGYETVTIK